MVESVERVAGQGTTVDAVLADAVPVLTRVAARLCTNAADAADLVQDTIERAMRLGLPAEVQKPTAWLTTMMHHLFIDRCRVASRAPVCEPLDDAHDRAHVITPPGFDVPEPAWSIATLDDVHAALATIDPAFREVYVLHTFQHRSYEEIAARLKISRFTVGTRLTRTRKMLRRELVKRLGRGTK
jgi:RNA polymerase sigma-70 factor (ECF subfamily)